MSELKAVAQGIVMLQLTMLEWYDSCSRAPGLYTHVPTHGALDSRLPWELANADRLFSQTLATFNLYVSPQPSTLDWPQQCLPVPSGTCKFSYRRHSGAVTVEARVYTPAEKPRMIPMDSRTTSDTRISCPKPYTATTLSCPPWAHRLLRHSYAALMCGCDCCCS